MAKYLDLDGLTRYNNKVNTKLDTKANVDGAYELMTVGNAEQLIASTTVEDKSPYLFRTSGGSLDIGDRLNLKSIVGGSVVWNQLVNTLNPSAEVYGITRTKVSTDIKDGLRVYGTCTASTYFPIAQIDNFNAEHKYFVSLGNVVLPSGSKLYLQSVTTANMQKDYVGTLADTPIAIYIVSGVAIDVIVKPQVFDLTAMFGSTIADYIYSLEQATAGSGIAWLKKYGFFTKPYYAYSANTMQSVNVSAHNTVGFNQWDEEWESGSYNWNTGEKISAQNLIRSKNKIMLIGGNTYYFKVGKSYNIFYFNLDGSYNSASYKASDGIITPSKNFYIAFSVENSTTYNHDICINFHWDGERDGEYEPYKKNSYDLSGSHEVQRKMSEIDLGDYTWTYHLESGNMYCNTICTDRIVKSGFISICSKYQQSEARITGVIGLTENGFYAFQDTVVGRIVIRDTNYTDATAFQTAMQGVKLVYELETPTTETVTNPTLRGIPKLDASNNLYYDGDSFSDFQNLQIVDDFGTEEFVDSRDVPIPVGHLTDYYPDLRAKLEMTPNLPNGNGDYLVRQTNGVNEYVKYVSPIPTPPTTDGTYVLKTTVSSGVATLSWVAE